MVNRRVGNEHTLLRELLDTNLILSWIGGA
jgi:hypothetical protein